MLGVLSSFYLHLIYLLLLLYHLLLLPDMFSHFCEFAHAAFIFSIHVALGYCLVLQVTPFLGYKRQSFLYSLLIMFVYHFDKNTI